ncbi:Putative mycotoxin biosynthesis protein UstYa [Septoria linicola]|uniref:Mycotoxin biosynthesis protein UstYa n=1 Tax=Septoria linicola TaxID=215465 RepID=A0A9Q9EEI1_9PEZI|nr:putative mycotoxin biosynthesis protein UstYa [Septoria linicola]USW47895.1 Putative mycotoxin biosynthesis protein UstYa [Septoria linicola]
MVSLEREYAPLVPEDEFENEKDVDQTPDDEGASESACRCCRGGSWSRRTVQLTKTKLVLCGVALVGVFLLGFATNLLLNDGNSQKAQIYDTDFGPARKSVELEQVRFSGSAQFDDEGEPYFDYDEHETVYTGTPTKAMDRAWNKLIRHRYFLINDEEALQAWGPDYEQYYRYPDSPKHEGGYVAGLDVLHTLHCVNMLRKALYKDHYQEHQHGSAKFQQYHIDHCLDIVRQNVQCNGDLTLIPTRWWEGMGKNGRNFIESDQVHTCRNFAKIREWGYQRFNRTHRVGKQHPPPANLAKHLEAIDSS